MKKKLLSILLAVMMVVSMGTMAFAADVTYFHLVDTQYRAFTLIPVNNHVENNELTTFIDVTENGFVEVTPFGLTDKMVRRTFLYSVNYNNTNVGTMGIQVDGIYSEVDKTSQISNVIVYWSSGGEGIDSDYSFSINGNKVSVKIYYDNILSDVFNYQIATNGNISSFDANALATRISHSFVTNQCKYKLTHAEF